MSKVEVRAWTLYPNAACWRVLAARAKPGPNAEAGLWDITTMTEQEHELHQCQQCGDILDKPPTRQVGGMWVCGVCYQTTNTDVSRIPYVEQRREMAWAAINRLLNQK